MGALFVGFCGSPGRWAQVERGKNLLFKSLPPLAFLFALCPLCPLSGIAYSADSQLSNYRDTKAILKRGPCDEELWSPSKVEAFNQQSCI